MDSWRTAIVSVGEKDFWIRGYDIGSLMQKQTFAGTVFLLHQGRLPTEGESRLLDAILISASDHGPGAPSAATARLACSGNRQSLAIWLLPPESWRSAMSTAAPGWGAWKSSQPGLQMAKEESISIEHAAGRIVDDAKASKVRLPGLGHRSHSEDPRKDVLIGIAHANTGSRGTVLPSCSLWKKRHRRK